MKIHDALRQESSRYSFGEVSFESIDNGGIVADLSATRSNESALFKAITQSHVTYAIYAGRPVPAELVEEGQRS